MNLKFLPIFLLCFTGLTFSQITTRVFIDGKITAPLGDDVEGVVVYNRTTDKGTITNDEGLFKIKVGVNDRIEVVAMQYQKFTVLVDQGVIDNKRLKIFLNESVNQLEEVVVSPYDLLGNAKADVAKINLNLGQIGTVANETSSRINDADYEFKPDELTVPENNAELNDGIMINGLNFVNLFKLVYDNTAKKRSKDKKLDDKIRKAYNDQFFTEYLALETDQINDFIYFAEANGLNEAYFKTGKELDLLQFLFHQSKVYKQRQQ